MRDVVVIGGGITGIQAALDLAGHGIRVHLIEREPSIGGHMAQLDKTFPTNDCSMCILSPKMVDVERHPLISVYTCSEVESIEGDAGAFTVRVRTNPRYIDVELCNGCGECIQVCPVEVYNRFDAGIGVRKAIYKPHPQAVPDIVVRDAEHCIECGLCYDICDLDAVKKEDSGTVVEIPASSIIISSGYRVFDPCIKPQFGYLAHPDVITSLEFERMISASGPTGGEIKRLSDGKTPGSIFFVQCVGSRDTPLKKEYCSCVCCMSAMKNAMLIKEKHPDIEVTICYIDMRAYGKGYEEYYQRAIRAGVRFLRGMPAEILGHGNEIEIRIEDSETGALEIFHPGLVVLSVGLEPADAGELAACLGVPIEQSGFFQALHDKVNTVGTIRPGIYIAGTGAGPKDIPDCVAQGGAAAMRAFIDSVKTGSTDE